MSRNPYARALRVKPQRVIPDKRAKLQVESDLHALYDDIIYERIPDDMRSLIEKLR